MKRQVLLLLFCAFPMFLYSHGKEKHATEAMEVLGLEENQKIRTWLEFISSSMIDSCDYNRFYTNLTTIKFKGNKKRNHFKYETHRALFHWPYNGEAWCNSLDNSAKSYCKSNKISNEDSIIVALKAEMNKERKKRKQEIKSRAQKIFGFNSFGIDREYTDFFCSIAYNVHLLGDYEPASNGLPHETKGMPNIDIIVKSMCKDISNFDRRGGIVVAQKLESICKEYGNSAEENAKKATKLIEALREEIPKLIQSKKGSKNIKKRLEKRGFKFR